MQLREPDSVARTSRRSRDHKGVEAIFSSQKSRRERGVLAGAAGVLSGLILSTFTIFRTDVPQTRGLLAGVAYSALTFGALGVLLLICGCGTLLFAVGHLEYEPSKMTALTTDGNLEFDDSHEAVRHDEAQRMFGPGFRTGTVAFVQSLVLVALYSGFVEEFESNSAMQIWVRSNFPAGYAVLNWEGVLILSVSLGLLMVEFLPGRFFYER